MNFHDGFAFVGGDAYHDLTMPMTEGYEAMSMKSAVRDFLSGMGVDSRGRRLDTILAWSDDALELRHDFIQWLFPLEQASRFNPGAPVLAPADFAELGRDEGVVAGLRAAFRRMLAFYGLTLRGPEVVKAENWAVRSANWAWSPTHNDLRITRILHSLALFGLHSEAAALLRFVETLFSETSLQQGRAEALRYWRDALKPEAFSQ